jgi:eukaryotic-like serine/threonine-protein kinase
MAVDAKTVKAIFLDALDKPAPADRAAYLDQACAGDAALRQSVEALLKSHDRPDALLDQPAVQHLPSGADAPTLDFLEPTTRPGALGRLGHYDVLEAVGQGGMGVVMRAFDAKLHRVVAIKALFPGLAANREARQRFVREAQAAAAVTHDNVISIHAVDDEGPVPYLVMQYIEGCTLQAKIDRATPLPLKEILRIGLQISEGLASAHRQGLIHRDIKPANILLENGIQRVKITDFGLARTVDDVSLTRSGYIAGTPLFMSPEQADGKRVDHRSDLFSLGSVLYALCSGHPPFQAESTVAILKRVCEETPRPLREVNPDVPEWLQEVIAKLHAKNPADRFASATDVAAILSHCLAQVQSGAGPSTTLERFLPRRPVRRGRWVAAVVLVLAIVGAGVAVGYFTQDRGPKPDSTVEAAPAPQPASTPQPWKPRPPLTPDELARLPDPLDEWPREGLPPDTRALIGNEAKEALPGLVRLLGDGPFRLPQEQMTHWPAQSADGRLLALPWGKNVIVYDAKTGTVRRKLIGHKSRAFRGGFSSDGQRYACSADGGDVRIWDVESGQEEKSTRATSDSPWATAFAPGDEQVVLAGAKGVIWVWDPAAGPELKKFGEHEGGCDHFMFSPDGKRLASGGKDRLVRIWSWPDGDPVRTLDGHRNDVMSVAYSANGELLASGSKSGVLIWNATTFEPLRTLDMPGDGLLRFTPEGQTLLTAPHFFPDGRRRAFSRWDVKTGVASAPFEVPGPRSLVVGDLSRDGRTVYLMTCDPGESRLGAYDAATGKERFPDHGLAGVVLSVAFSPDGRWLASAGDEGRICLWDLAGRPAGEVVMPARQLKGHTGAVSSVAFSPDGQLLAAGGTDEKMRLWKVADGQQVHELTGYYLRDALLTFSPDCETLAAGNRDGGVNLWNVLTGQLKESVHRHVGRVRAVAFSPDGKWLATAGFDDKTVQLIDRASGQSVPAFRGEVPLTGLTFSPNSGTLAAIGTAPVPSAPFPPLYIWDVATRTGRTLAGHDKRGWGIAFHPAGNWVATASRDGIVRLRETAPGGDEKREFDFRRFGPAYAVAFTPSGRHFAVGLNNGMIAILETPAPKR